MAEPTGRYTYTGVPGDWFEADFAEPAGEDSGCPYGCEIVEGDIIRSDGMGHFEHQICVESGHEGDFTWSM